MKRLLLLALLASTPAIAQLGDSTTIFTKPIGRLHARIYRFEPLPDITAYELALATRVLMQSMTVNDPNLVDRLPSEVKRHFTEVVR